MIEKFLEVWQSISNQDFEYGLLQLETEIRADERRKFAEYMRIKFHVDVSEYLEWYEKEQNGL